MQKFFTELGRRNLFRVALAYLMGSWLLLQAVALLAGVLGLPGWTQKLVVVLIVLGLLPVLLFAWIYEITPEGLKRERDMPVENAARRVSTRRLNLAIAGMMVVAVPLFAVQLVASGGIGALILPESAPTIQSRVDASGLALPEYDSVAVLPFVNTSADPGNEYFSDGLSEELLNLLSGVRGLRVPSRTSSFAFKGKPVELAVIAGALGVNHVLEGSVQRVGERVRVTARLVEVQSGTQLWSESYDRELTDIFQVQDDIAGRIVAALRSSLGDRGLLPERRHPTAHMEAYELYLQGLELFRQRGDGAGLPEAVKRLDQAVAADPGFADAWATLAAAHAISRGYVRERDIDGSIDAAREAARRALQLDPGSSLAKAVLADTFLLKAPRQWREGLERFAEGVISHPRDASMRLRYGVNLIAAGYLQEGKIQLLAAYRQDPAAGLNNALLARAHLMTGDLDRAVSHFNRAMALGHQDAQNQLRQLYFQMGLDERVLESPDLGPGVIPVQWWQQLLDTRKDPGRGPDLLAATRELLNHGDAVPGGSAGDPVLHSGLVSVGLLDAYAEHIREAGDGNTDELQAMWLPWNASLRQSEQFRQLAEDLGLMALWRSRGFPDLCRETDGRLECS